VSEPSNVMRMPGVAANPKAKLPQQGIIEMLESYLEEAKAGELCGLVIGAVTNTESGFGTLTSWSSGSAPASMMLAIAAGLEARVKQSWLED